MPDRLRIRNTQNYARNFPLKSISYKKRTKSGSQQLWREWAVERAKWALSERTRSTGTARKPADIGLLRPPSRRQRLLVQGAVAERVGFEPTVRLHAQRFSRPSRSTTLAPLRGLAYRGVALDEQHRRTSPEYSSPALTRRPSCVYSALLRRVFRPAVFFRALRHLGASIRPNP